MAERYVVHGKSAFHGKHQVALDRAFDDMAADTYAVLVVWQPTGSSAAARSPR